MADYTPSYAANIAVRAFLTNITETILKQVFNHSRVDNPNPKGKMPRIFGKQEWEKIKCWFGGTCAYCGQGQSKEMTVDHLAMFNRIQGGLQHPRNVVPSCRSCNNNRRKKGKANGDKYYPWEHQLKQSLCKSDGNQKNFEERKKKITDHISKYNSMSDVGNEDVQLLAVGKNYIKAAGELHKKVTDAIKVAQSKNV
jgi:hypothetical protein